MRHNRKYVLFALLIALSMVATACAPQAAATDEAQLSEMAVQSTGDLVSALNDAGVEAQTGNSVTQPFFEMDGQIVQLEDAELQVFEFENEAKRQGVSELIRDGSLVDESSEEFAGAPVFWADGSLIVMYLGDDPVVIESLNLIMGPAITEAEASEGS